MFFYIVLFLKMFFFNGSRLSHNHHLLMAVAPASMADKIIVLGDDEEDESLNSCCSISTSLTQPTKTEVFQPPVQQPVSSHITHSPFASDKKDARVLQAENQRLFAEVSYNTPNNLFWVFVTDKNNTRLLDLHLSFSPVCGSLFG